MTMRSWLNTYRCTTFDYTRLDACAEQILDRLENEPTITYYDLSKDMKTTLGITCPTAALRTWLSTYSAPDIDTIRVLNDNHDAVLRELLTQDETMSYNEL